jgi:nucleoside-diphosphate-sugar epimerase
MPALFVTGATGFVGRSFVQRIAARDDVTVTALARRVPAVPHDPSVRWVQGDLLRDGDWRSALEGADTVLHLAAATGKLPPEEIRRVNVEATERLLGFARAAGVERFLFVSSIAAKFADAPHYHYAAAKRAAEKRVTDSGLHTLTVRPTMVLGSGSPIGQRLRMLAAAPVIVVFGNGRARIQPVHVDDLAAILIDLALSGPFDGRTVEVGGADAIEIEAFLRMVRSTARGSGGAALHVPVGPLRAGLALVERVSVKLVPFTAGQLASFTNDGTVGPDAGYDGAITHAHDLASIVAATAADA